MLDSEGTIKFSFYTDAYGIQHNRIFEVYAPTYVMKALQKIGIGTGSQTSSTPSNSSMSKSNAMDMLFNYAEAVQSRAPFMMGTSMKCKGCSFATATNELIMNIQMVNVSNYMSDADDSAAKFYLLTTIRENLTLCDALKSAKSTITVWLTNKGGDDIGSMELSSSDL